MKKAMIPLLLIVLFGVIGGVTFAWYASLKAGNFGNVKMIGADQISILERYRTAESDLLYLDMTSQYLAEITLGQTLGGEYETQCGSYAGYPLFSDAQQLCFPAMEALSETIDLHMGPLLEEHVNKQVPSSEITFDFLIRQDTNHYFLIAMPSGALEYTLTPFGAEAK